MNLLVQHFLHVNSVINICRLSQVALSTLGIDAQMRQTCTYAHSLRGSRYPIHSSYMLLAHSLSVPELKGKREYSNVRMVLGDHLIQLNTPIGMADAHTHRSNHTAVLTLGGLCDWICACVCVCVLIVLMWQQPRE